MTAAPEFILGFDPGGKGGDSRCKKQHGNGCKGHFGWSVCKTDGEKLCRVNTGLASNAYEVLYTVKEIVGESRVLAAGIDAPLLWGKTLIKTGYRKADDILRCVAPEKSNSVVHINGLYGAVTVQGVWLAKLLHEDYRCHCIKITETHPAVLRHLIGQRPKEDEILKGLLRFIENDPGNHRRDATVSAFAAWAMHKQFDGWSNLYEHEPGLVQPFGTCVSYWMPITP